MEEESVIMYGFDRHRFTTDGEGVTSLVTLRECPLKCKYCINDECHVIPDNPFFLTASKVVEKCMIDNLYYIYTNGGITVGGGEALLHPRFLHELRKKMPEEWNLNLETSLNVPRKNVEMIIDDIHEWIIDIKDMNPEIYKRYTECSNERVLDNLSYLVDLGLQERCIIRIPLIPHYNTDADRQKSVEQLKQMKYERIDLFEYCINNENNI